MSYVIDEPSMVWLLIDESGQIVAMAATAYGANLIAQALASTVEAARQGQFKMGDVLPLFHV